MHRVCNAQYACGPVWPTLHIQAVLRQLQAIFEDFQGLYKFGTYKTGFHLRVTRPGCEFDGDVTPESKSIAKKLWPDWLRNTAISGYGGMKSRGWWNVDPEPRVGGGGLAEGRKKKSDPPFWWWNWPLPQQKWLVARLRMVLLEFKICISCCSYFLSHTRGREAILDSSPSPKLTKWEYAKEITVMNFTRTQVTDTNQGFRNKNQFTADSKLHCEACDTDMHVGTGGTSNLNAHRDQIETR